MVDTQGGSSSAADASVVGVRWDVIFHGGYGGWPRRDFSGEQDASAAVSQWEYRDYAEWCAGWLEKQGFAEMGFNGNNLVVYDQNCRARDIAEGAYVCLRKALERTYSRICFGFEHVNMPRVRHSDKVDYVSRLSDWFQKCIDTRTLDLSYYCLSKPFHSYYLV